MTMREMLERQTALRIEMRGLHDKAAGEQGNLSAEQQSRWDAAEAELDGLKQRSSRQATLDDAERRMHGEPVTGTGDAKLDSLLEGIGLLDTMRAQMGATDLAAGRAKEASAELERRSGRRAQGLYWHTGAPIERRVVTTALPVGGPGSNLIGQDYRPELFIDVLRAKTQVRSLGATVLSGLTGNVTIPRRKTAVAAGWAAENTPLPNSDPAFDAVTLTPKHAGVITEWSRNMIMQASPDIEMLARNDMAAVLAQTLDSAAIAGTGTNAQPTGILSTSGIGSVVTGTNGGLVSYNAMCDLMGAVADSNADGDTAAFLTNTKVRRAASKLIDGQGRPIGLSTIFQGQTVAYSNLVPANATKGTGTNLSAVIYGTWSDLLIGLWSELDILVNPFESVAYSKGNVQIRAMMTCDIAVRHPQSFAAVTDIAA